MITLDGQPTRPLVDASDAPRDLGVSEQLVASLIAKDDEAFERARIVSLLGLQVLKGEPVDLSGLLPPPEPPSKLVSA